MRRLFLIACVLAAAAAGEAQAGVIVLDFDSPGTGSQLLSGPLLTPFGTISASASGSSTLFLIADPPNTGMVGNALLHVSASDEYGQLAFSFPVTSISFLYGGYIAGFFRAQALDAGLNVVDTFYDGDTNADLPGGPATLSGADIRYLRFADAPGGLDNAVVDDVRIETPVPEPATMLMLGGGLLGLAARRRRR